ncbi:hypothetical protein HPB51_001623 [Rhipicephalus microplus]|uniref:Uncharacterized protein n=1 Tax=Rhipicephalus microplus TaxID=6941 RepID=A0A9J6DY01_RHIMP|nr:hypothetical protein HPB51_001623 [Rhipicephalus microplus]
MTAQLTELLKMAGKVVAVFPKRRCKMAPAGLFLRAPPPSSLLRTPPLELHRRLACVPVTAVAQRGIGPTPPLALPGAGHVRGVDIVDTSRGSAALLRSPPVILRLRVQRRCLPR